MGIIRKLKTCKGCGHPSYIWKNGMCKACSWKADKNSGKRTYKIKPITDKRKEANVEYLFLRTEYLNTHQKCEIGIPGLCSSFATEIHHAAGKVGKLLTEVKYFKATCRKCHHFVEMNPSFAKEQGFSVTRLDK